MLDRTTVSPQFGAWQRFCSVGEITSDAVSDAVARSWLRCRDTGLHPHAPKAPVRLSADEVANLRRENQLYLEAVAPSMSFPLQAIRDSGFIMVVADASGVVLELYGAPEIIARAKANNYLPGCCRSEDVAGTNAIGLAMVERRAVQLSGAEHYNVRHHGWTCASTPVFGPDGALLGTITLSGESGNTHIHTLGLVVAAAEVIQARLREMAMEAQIRSSERVARSILAWLPYPTVTINATGEIVHLNQSAESLFGGDRSRFGGRSITSLLSGPQITDLVAGKPSGNPFEAVCEINGRRAPMVVKPIVIRDERDKGMQGAILSLVRRDQQKRFRGQPTPAARFSLEDIIGEHPDLRRQVELARMVAAHDTRVLIAGETGTGKELLAQGIHNASGRVAGPFVALNCAAVPRELIESELLGYKDGAFTGAQRGGQVGKIELADGGTLFLDEISQMPVDMQAKLLRVLQDGIVTRLGDTVPLQVDVRIIAASNENLYEKSLQGAFRRDLYFRLAVMEITLPPLRERVGDIELLAKAILKRLSVRLNTKAARLSDEVLALLRRYRWPGNVRELENALEMALLLSRDGVIRPEHLPARVQESGTGEESPSQSLAHCTTDTTVASHPPAGETLSDMQMEAIRNALREYDCNISKVSRALGISRSTIYRKMREIGINRVVSLS